MLMCVSCFGLVVSTCQVIGWKDTSDDTFMWWGDYLHIPRWKRLFVYIFFFDLVCLCCYVFSPRPYTVYISYAYGMI